MVIYVPGTEETDPKKQNMSLQQLGGAATALQTSVATNTTNIAANTASISNHESAWTAYTPTLTTSPGAYTTASATGRYHQIGKTVFVYIEITITTIGTATSYPQVTLPVAPLSNNTALLHGRERTATGKAVHSINSGGSTMIVVNYDNSPPASSGMAIDLSGTYEAA